MFFEISRRLTSGKSFRKLILSKCPNDWTITMIWRIFITFREYVRVRKIYLDNQLPKCVEISWRYTFRYSFRKIVLTKNYNNWIIICYLTKFHHFLSTYILSELRSFNLRRGNLEILFLPKFQKKNSYKSVMIIVSYQ